MGARKIEIMNMLDFNLKKIFEKNNAKNVGALIGRPQNYNLKYIKFFFIILNMNVNNLNYIDFFHKDDIIDILKYIFTVLI